MVVVPFNLLIYSTILDCFIFFIVYLDLMTPGFGFIGNNIKNAAFNCLTHIVYKNK